MNARTGKEQRNRVVGQFGETIRNVKDGKPVNIYEEF